MDQGMRDRYDTYTTLIASQEKFYQECVNTKFQKGRIRTAFLISESSWTNKTKYCHFHKVHDHNTDEFIKLKEIIKGLIKIVRLYEYVKGGKNK